MSRRRVDHADLGAAGYFTNWSVAAGGTADFHLSTVDPATAVSLTRLDRAGASGIDARVSRTEAPLAVQQLEIGASLTLAIDAGRLAADWGLSLELRLRGMPHHRVLLAANGFSLLFDATGRLDLHAGESGIVPGTVLPTDEWLILELRHRRGGLELRIDRCRDDSTVASLEAAIACPLPTEIAIARGPTHGPTDEARSLNATIGRIALHGDDAEIAAFHIPAVGRRDRMAPTRGAGAALRFHNAPTFASRSPRWDGSQGDPSRAPDHYDAVALHDDDLDDARWPVTHRVVVSPEAESGVYGLTVRANGEAMTWPFFVTPRRRSAHLVFLAPTFTYLAYADERLPEDQFPWQCDDAGHRFARANDLASLYDLHNDGTGVSLASFRRPLTTIRDDYLYPLCGAPHLLPVDLHLLRFLAAQDIRVDLITDAELDRDGAAALAGYRGLITGSHPEYWTAAMRGALDSFTASGGHLAYLGGNGGYWVTACDGHTIEVRRGERGIRTWSSEPGETHLAMTGEPGGLWRNRGRAEHQLLGVGLAAMGFSAARPFRRTAESYAADLAWLFEGVGDGPIGSEGMMLGGASGYEVDRRNTSLGTPRETVTLAVADGFDSAFEIDPTSGAHDVRGEMTLTQKADGGLVFSAASVTWCGAIPEPGAMNAVGRIMLNLLARFRRA